VKRARIRIATSENEGRFHHYADVVKDERFEWLGSIQSPFDTPALNRIDALIVSDEFYINSRLAMLACKKRGIPTFHVIDGILEWRNLFEHPRSMSPESGAPLFRPLIADCTFAMGVLQKQILYWLYPDNTRVSASGLPRLDHIIQRQQKSLGDTRKLLIATANTPWFNDSQQRHFRAEFSTFIREVTTTLPSISGQWECIWRVADVVAKEFSLQSDTASTLAEALRSCDAVITTPSTVAVEAMLTGVPTAVFDPYCAPVLTPTAWYANSAKSIVSLLPSLLRPCREKLSYQAMLLDWICPTDRSAASRVADIIVQTVHNGVPPKEGLASGRDLQVPLHVLEQSPAVLSQSDLLAAALTLPTLEARIADQSSRIRELEHQIVRPTLRQGFGAIFRSVTGLPPRQRT